MKWTRSKTPGPEYLQAEGYIVNKASVCGEVQYMAVRLGTPYRDAWNGSVILGVVDSADGAKELCRRDRDASSSGV